MIKPMLCKLTEEKELKALTETGHYIFEPKLDGARIITVIHGTEIKMFGRSGLEKTHQFPDLKFNVTGGDIIIDGEVLAGNSFNDLQHRNRLNGVSQAVVDHPARYSVFDVLEIGGVSVVKMPLISRKELLKGYVHETENVSLTPSHFDGVALFNAMKTNKLEGVVGKAKDGVYSENKRDWLKVKCWKEGKYLAVGYTLGTGVRQSTFGALVLSDFQGHYVGAVGTGFTEDMIQKLMKDFVPGPCQWKREPEAATWILPFAVNIRYLELTNDGMLRFPAFKGVV